MMWTRRKCGRSANDGCRRGFAARLIRIARFYILGGHSPSAICDSSSFVRGWTIRRSAVMGSRKNLRPFHCAAFDERPFCTVGFVMLFLGDDAWGVASVRGRWTRLARVCRRGFAVQLRSQGFS